MWADVRLIKAMQDHLSQGDDNRFLSCRLKGRTDGKMDAWLGVYPYWGGSKQQLRFLRLNPARRDLTEKKMRRDTQSYLRAFSSLGNAPLGTIYTTNVSDAELWKLARQESVRDWLPICFVGVGKNWATFYYSRIVPPDWMWLRFKMMAG